MSKKFIITEEERNEIKSLYKINEGAGDIIPVLFSAIFSSDDEEEDNNKSTTDLTGITEKGQELLNNDLFYERLSDISSKIGVDENSIINLIPDRDI